MLYSWAETLQCYSVSLYPCIQAAGCEYPLVVSYILRFHCHTINTAQKKKTTRNRPVEEAEKMKCYKTLIYKQFVQVSGLCDPQFLSYLPKRFTHLCRPLHIVWRRHIGVPFWYTTMSAGNQQKHLELTFSLKALSFHSRTSIRAYINISSNT